MSIKNKNAKPVKEVAAAMAQADQNKTEVSAAEAAEIKEVIQSAGIEPAPVPLPEPPKKVLTLAEREKAIRENADRLKGLQTLRAELDQLRSWGFADNGTNATLRLSGEENFTTSNSRLIAKLKTTLESLFEERIAELETEIETAVI